MSSTEFLPATNTELNGIYTVATDWLAEKGEIFAPTEGIIGSYNGFSIVNDKDSLPPVQYQYGPPAEVIDSVLPGAMELLGDWRSVGLDYLPAYFYLAEAGIQYKPGSLGITLDDYDPAKPHSRWHMTRLIQAGAPGLPTNIRVERQETSTKREPAFTRAEEKPKPSPKANLLSGAEAIAFYGIAQSLSAIRAEEYRQRRQARAPSPGP